ncbi:MAG: hypothetical protein COV66_11495 [Nitrospinae bacterium CG11_big_fil_rev_8_21_14_0_20_45_15]|nr:MAG: hypothetical protein COV66_11495 [Nitrospinae bacterium CG11_big_fil_rev_8_21_14_0_20_45_15]
MAAFDLKILSLQYYTYPDAIGGAWKVTFELNHRLAKRGHSVSVITCKPNEDFLDEESIEGVAFHRISSTSAKTFWSLARSLWQKIASLCKEGPIDIIHVHNPLTGFIALLHPALWDIPVACHFHSAWYDEEKINRYGNETSGLWQGLRDTVALLAIRLMEWFCFFRAHRVVVLSAYSLRRFRHYFPFYGTQTNIISGGVDTEEFRPAKDPMERETLRDKYDLPQNTPVLLTVRRLHYRMGLENLLQALAIVSKKSPDAEFLVLIAGEGPLRETLSRQIGELQLQKKVRLTGMLSQQSLPEYYRCANLFILPTLMIEGFGLSTAEALATGLPVLGTPVGATQNILGSINVRMLFAGTDPDALANGILDYLKNPQSFSDLSKICRERATALYSWDSAVLQIEELFTQMKK